MTERDRVQFGDTTIEYQVRRSKRRKRTIQITVDGGGVRVAAPMKTPDGELRAFVRKRAAWITKHAAKAQEAAPRRFVTGETLPYLGRDVPIVVEPAGAPSPEVRFDRRRFRIAAPSTLNDEERSEQIRRAIVGWYWARAAERFPARVERWWPRLGRGSKPRVLVRDQRLQLARHDAGARAHRLYRRPRAGPSDPSESLGGLLGAGTRRDAGRRGPAPASAGGWPLAAPVTPAVKDAEAAERSWR